MILPSLNAATLPAGPVVRMLFLQRSTVHLHPRPQGAFFVRAREFVRGPHRIRSSRSVLIMLPNRVAARGFPYTLSTLITHPAKWKFLRLHRPDDSSPGNGLSTPPPAHAVSTPWPTTACAGPVRQRLCQFSSTRPAASLCQRNAALVGTPLLPVARAAGTIVSCRQTAVDCTRTTYILYAAAAAP